MEEVDELLEWWNEQFETQHRSLAAFADGVQYMQLIDALLPDGGLLHALQMAPRSHQERVRNLQSVQQAIQHTGIGVELPDLDRLAAADEAEHFLVASALRDYAEDSALRMDALEGYAALKARMEAAAAGGSAPEDSPLDPLEPMTQPADHAHTASSTDPKLMQRRDELGQLVECLQQELAKRMRSLEDVQAEFYEVRHERELLFGALQRIEHVCLQRCEGDPEDMLASDLLRIIAEVPPDFLPNDEAEDAVVEHTGGSGNTGPEARAAAVGAAAAMAAASAAVSRTAVPTLTPRPGAGEASVMGALSTVREGSRTTGHASLPSPVESVSLIG